MTRYIIISWLCVVIGFATIVPLSSFKASPSLVILFAIGNLFMVLPNVIWIFVSNKVSARSLGKAPSKAITMLAIMCFVSFALTFIGLSVMMGTSPAPSSSGIWELFLGLSFVAAFVSLIAGSIKVSAQIVDAQEHPKAGRGSRIFVLTLCFFYILIGMFFIATKLKQFP